MGSEEIAIDFGPPTEVVVDATLAEAFARETGVRLKGKATPLAYPAVWLAQPRLREKIAKICAEADALPVHESQRFTYETPLRQDVRYLLAVAARREARPARLVLDATLSDSRGASVGRFETVLRLVSRADLAKKGDA
ncbi:hypothetical protein [Methylocystis bryophila]|uniref:N-terminal of MaoC-like dehydratase domain-containing protein n=1 Tax=Methylocystis bryophila TaxID=655015 RepID=A0A1W6MUL7_9HYPH|nr:hypothetical protein [Methylocystis bryophila]ARN81308.1 hypothetical protein B1812_09705 [Methylocystis bryophila]BDV37278.1 hypothetical protein DSM21852_05310 [Methylocystis bryophila]